MTAADTEAPSLGKAARVILGLGLPLLIGALSSSMAGAVDIAMMGYYGEADLAAVAGAAALCDILGGIVIASVTGHQILAARFAGRDDPAGIRQSLRSSAIFCGGIALALALAVAIAGRQLTGLVVGGDRQLSAIGAQYLAARAPTMLMLVAFALLAAVFNAYKKPRYAMVAGLVINAVNIGLDWLLIYGPGPAPRLGATGNGLATTLSWAVGVACLLVAARRFGLRPLLRRPAATEPVSFVTSVPRLSWPAIVSTGLDYLSTAVFFGIVGTIGGVALGGGRIAFEVMILIFGVASAFGAAARILIGRSAGSDQMDEVATMWRAGQLILFLPALGLGLLLGALPASAARVFTNLPEVADAAADALLFIAISLPLMAWTLGNVSLLRALGHTDRDMYANLIAAIGVQLPMSWALGVLAGFGLAGAFAGVVGYWLVRAAVTEVMARHAVRPLTRSRKESVPA